MSGTIWGPTPVTLGKDEMRADAQRNRDRLVAVAAEVVGQYGGRIDLLEAVFRSSIDAVCAQATELLDDPDHLQALTSWLHTVVAHATGSRGLATALVMSGDCGSDAHARLLSAGRKLLDRAQKEDVVPEDTRIEDLLKLANGISLASGDDPDQAARLLTLAIRGIAPTRSE